jgi:hypothetical protein
LRRAIILLLFALAVPAVQALHGGDNLSYYFDRCDNLKVDVGGSLPIDSGEYTILNNCTEVNNNSWECNCHDGYNFSIYFDVRTLNNYSITFNYEYLMDVEDKDTKSHSTSSGSGWAFNGLRNGSKIVYLNYGDVFEFFSDDHKHNMVILKVGDETITMRVSSTPTEFLLSEGSSLELDLDDDDVNDVEIKLLEITSGKGGKFRVTILDGETGIPEKPPVEGKEALESAPGEIEGDAEEPEEVEEVIEYEEEPKPKWWLLVIAVVLLLFGMVMIVVIYIKLGR